MARSVRRYSIVRAVSRGGDLFISSTIEALFGGSWIWYMCALGVGGTFNVLTDYLGQKYWVPGTAIEGPVISVKETGRYAAVRVYYLPIGFGAHAILYLYIGLPFILSSVLVSIGLWIMSYRNTRGIFVSKTTRWIPWPFRSLVIRRLRNQKQKNVRSLS